MISKYGSDKITDISDGEHQVCMSMVDIYDDGVIITFSFEEEKLESITAIYSEEKTQFYLADPVRGHACAVPVWQPEHKDLLQYCTVSAGQHTQQSGK
jgi:hypothetical protein